MSYKPCNEVVEDAFRVCMTAPADQVVVVPWIKGHTLNALGRLSLISAAATRSLGVATKGGRFRIYYGQNHAGNWFFEVMSVWKAALIAAPIVVGLCYGNKYAHLSYGGAWLALVSGLLALIAFAPRAFYQNFHSALANVHKGFAGPTGVVNVLMTAAGIGSAIAGYSGISGGGSRVPLFTAMVRGNRWEDANTQYIVGQLIGDVVLAYGLVVVVGFICWGLLGVIGNKIAVSRVFELGHNSPVTQSLYHSGVASVVEQPAQIGRGMALLVYWCAALILATWPMWWK
ncbi:hypothetical protein [Pseudomonas sp. GM_Psu_2]|uniref:hypothetical protein n=1 Tax=unclassified Pseudomonas TaxID=196821 RepID=UPI00226AA26A|nr:hypothetical protein [Pseudomonas sp. GM_Psu_2]